MPKLSPVASRMSAASAGTIDATRIDWVGRRYTRSRPCSDVFAATRLFTL